MIPPIPMWFYAVAAAVLLIVGAAGGAHWQGDYDDMVAAKLAAKTEHAAQVERARTDAVTAAIATKAASQAAEDEKINETIAQSVPRLVQKNDTRAGFANAIRLLNNAAATGLPVSDAAGPVDDAPAAVEGIAAGVEANIAQCRADLKRFAELQDWLDGVTGHDDARSNSAGDGRRDAGPGGDDYQVDHPSRNPPGGDGSENAGQPLSQ